MRKTVNFHKIFQIKQVTKRCTHAQKCNLKLLDIKYSVL